jgi:hypothetical protein
MGLRFERSLGVIRLVRWNVRESALMFRLGLLKLAENIRPANVRNPVAVLDTGRSHPSFFSGWLPAPSTETGQCSQQILQPEISPLSAKAPLGRMLLKIAFMAALFLGGYLTGRLTTLESPPADANTNEALAAPSAPEPVAPLALAQPVTVLPETSSALALVSEKSASKPVSTAIGNTRPLSSDEVLETQAWLKAFGFDPGPLDGLPGPKTTDAVKRYRTARQMEETDALDRSVLQQVRQQVRQSSR